MHEVLVNRLGGLSLPRKSVVRLTDRPDMTLDVHRGRKTTMQQQNRNHKGSTFTEKDRNKLNYQIGPKWTLSPNQTRLCGPCIAAISGSMTNLSVSGRGKIYACIIFVSMNLKFTEFCPFIIVVWQLVLSAI